MKRNKSLKIIAILIPAILLGVMFYFFDSYKTKKASAEQLQTIPAFSLKTIKGEIFTANDLTTDRNKVLVYFSPNCHYCQGEAEDLAKIYAKYPDVHWVWIASEPLDEIKTFAEKYQLDQQENIHWCQDEMATLYQKFAMSSVPFFLAYDKNSKQVFRNKGAVKLEKILKSFDEGK